MNKIFIYCRKSSESEDRQILSIDSQIAELQTLATSRGVSKFEILTEAKSAKEPGRTVFNSMMARLNRGEAEGIICWKLDRLARNPVDGGAVIWAVKQHGIQIITPTQSFGRDDDNSILMYLEFGMAQKYVDDLSRNVKRGMRTKAESGWFPGPAPLGYLNVTTPRGERRIEKDPERFDLIRRMWRIMLSGNVSARQILRLANDVWQFRTRGGRPLAHSAIYKIFKTPFYFGSYEFPAGSGQWFKGTHEPMISRAEFDRVQEMLGRIRKSKRWRREFPLTRCIRCGECGAAVTAEEKRQVICSACRHKFAAGNRNHCPRCQIAICDMDRPKRRRYVYYHCTHRRNVTCRQRSIEGKALWRQLKFLLKELHLQDENEHWIRVRLKRISRKSVPSAIADFLPTEDPATQRRILSCVFSEVTLRDGQLLAVPRPPFSPLKLVVPIAEQKTFSDQLLNEAVSGPGRFEPEQGGCAECKRTIGCF